MQVAHERVIFKLMAKDRTDRFQTTKELQEALTKAGGKLGRGGWLHKGSMSAVPLVRAYDPVAPHKGPKRRSDSGQGGKPALPQAKSSSDNNRLVRAAAGPGNDYADAIEGARSIQAEAPAYQNEYPQSQLRSTYSASTRGDSSKDAVDEEFDHVVLAAPSLRFGESVPLQPSAVLTSFEDSTEDVIEKELPEWSRSEDESFAELVADQTKKTRVRMAIALVVVLGVAAGAFLLMGRSLLRPIVLKPSDRLLLTLIQNKTGDQTLDGTVMQGLEIALHQCQGSADQILAIFQAGEVHFRGDISPCLGFVV